MKVLLQLVNNSKSGPIQLAQCHLDAIENICVVTVQRVKNYLLSFGLHGNLIIIC